MSACAYRSSSHLQRADAAVCRETKEIGAVRGTAWNITRDRRHNHGEGRLNAALDRLRCDAILRARTLLPRTDALRACDVAALVAHDGIGCEADHHRLDVVRL